MESERLEEQAQVVEAPGDIQQLCAEAARLRGVKDELARAEKAANEAYEKVTSEILRTLELMEIDSVRAHGYLFFKEVKTSVTTPKSIEDKKALFAYLESKGIHDEMVSINSQTLNSLYKSLAEDAAREGVLDFRLPGVAEPTIFTTLKLRKG